MKPKIEKIKFTKEQQQQIDKLLKESTFEQLSRRKLLQFYGGSCCICGQWPDFKVIYDVDGAKRIERYCKKDFDIRKDGIK